MALSQEAKIPSRGYTFHLTAQSTHVIDGPNAGLPALPAYPISNSDANWDRLYCVSEPTGMGGVEVQTAEFRCGDPEAPIVEDFATGFLKLLPVTIMLTWGRDVYEKLIGYRNDRTKVRYLYQFPLRAGETAPSRLSCRAFVTVVEDRFDQNGAPVMIALTLQKTDDVPIFVKGS